MIGIQFSVQEEGQEAGVAYLVFSLVLSPNGKAPFSCGLSEIG